MSLADVNLEQLPSSIKRSFDLYISGEPLKEADIFRLRYTGLVQLKTTNEIVLTTRGMICKSQMH